MVDRPSPKLSPAAVDPSNSPPRHSPPSLSPPSSTLLTPPGLDKPSTTIDETPNAPFTPSLQIRTDLPWVHSANLPDDQRISHDHDDLRFRRSLSSASLPRRAPSIRNALVRNHSNAGSLSPGSVFSSPQLNALTDLTPLPSPVGPGSSSWKLGRSLSRNSSSASMSGSAHSLRGRGSFDMPRSSSTRRKPYTGLAAGNTGELLTTPQKGEIKHTRNRSLSEYGPDQALHVPRPRKVTVSGTQPPKLITPSQMMTMNNTLHREEYLAVQRGIALPDARPPTPPRSVLSGYDSSDTDPTSAVLSHESSQAPMFHVKSVRTNQPRTYRTIRQLGQGTFSQVVLAVRENLPVTSASTPQRLVAIKVVNWGPAGGADEERVEISLKREVEILKSVDHPSLVQLKAFGSDKKSALLVLDYCPGGDLFEFASQGVTPLRPCVIRRIFAELIAAVRYLHSHFIVHRDIKLENVLVNIPATSMLKIPDWRTYPNALVVLSDLGLSRRIPQPPESPLLHTRCGSEDYAAPEILMGQPYDGRSTDGWALGVLLYAIMESRLPFDALPGTRGDPEKLRARTPHRIARCEWSWYRFADGNGEWDPTKGEELEDARACVEGLLKRSSRRMNLDNVADMEWVKGAIELSGPLKRGDREVP